MSIPYLPGWWDEINRGGAVTNFVSQLPGIIQPDRVAGKRLQELVQQNPMLMTQISEMDEGQRQAFANALGFRDFGKSGLGNLSEGPQLRQRREVERYLATATPEQKDIALAAKAGTKSKRELTQNDTLFGLGVQEKEQNIRTGAQQEQLNAIKLNEAKELENLSSTLKVKYPADTFNVQRAAMDFISGRLDTPELQRITTDPTIAGAFNTYIDLYKQRLQLSAQRDIASLRSPQERMFGLQYLQMNVDNAQQQLNSVNNEIKALGGFGNITNPAQYQVLMQQREAAQKQYNEFNAAFTRAMESKLGKEFQSSFGPGAIDNSQIGPRNPNALKSSSSFFGMPSAGRSPQVEKIKADYATGKITATAIRSSQRISEEDKAYILGSR